MKDGAVPTTSTIAIKVRTGSADENGLLMLLHDKLIAILVELSDEIHADKCGRWALESTFGLFDIRAPETFESIDQAWDWVMRAANGTQWPVIENPRRVTTLSG